ncbi:hypothetical protein K505DRAFT_300397 [Melanomma pulvis-pyrius CBS 109.77]|uniref:Tat pathway signal sequence n=1 Tax=Melanomma pulvis-pyrius CBS 109.77 TaxID=1314802 RepID=A0A6A6XLC5_9PLEO|nr:hypothetical protein K505DRAFT_300397 [Melanomma pulvis-pyrius CBS 109.77]
MMSCLPKFEYKPIASGENRDSSFETDADETKGYLNEAQAQDGDRTKANWRVMVLLTILNACVLILSSTLFGTWFYNRHIILNAEYRRVSSYSPVHDRFDLDPTFKKINGTFYRPKDGGSIARQQPNPKADAIWDEWELTRVYPITREEIIKMGKDPTTVAKLDNDVWGLGDDAHAAIFDAYHQIHCLNSLRHIAYGEYYNLSMARAHTIKQREIHINHCIDILLQGIQCNANLDLIPLHWVETQEYPFPDMSINKKCVNFDKFTDWRKENTIDMDKYVKVMQRPEGDKPGIKQLPAADQYYEYWGYDNPNHKPKSEGGHGLPLDIDSNL